MKRSLAFLILLLSCSKAPPPSGHGGAQATAARGVTGSGGASSASGSGGTMDAGQGGKGGKDWDGGSGGTPSEIPDSGPDCGPPNGGIGPCVDPTKDCPPETECWSWKCEFGMCTHVPKF